MNLNFPEKYNKISFSKKNKKYEEMCNHLLKSYNKFVLISEMGNDISFFSTGGALLLSISNKNVIENNDLSDEDKKTREMIIDSMKFHWAIYKNDYFFKYMVAIVAIWALSIILLRYFVDQPFAMDKVVNSIIYSAVSEKMEQNNASIIDKK